LSTLKVTPSPPILLLITEQEKLTAMVINQLRIHRVKGMETRKVAMVLGGKMVVLVKEMDGEGA
jgi:hypothetical protein